MYIIYTITLHTCLYIIYLDCKTLPAYIYVYIYIYIYIYILNDEDPLA